MKYLKCRVWKIEDLGARLSVYVNYCVCASVYAISVRYTNGCKCAQLAVHVSEVIIHNE